MKNTKTKRMLAVAALLAVGLALMLYYAAHKQGYHVDELYTYELANYPGGFYALEDGYMDSWHDGSFYSAVLTPGRLFDYTIPWNNQKIDVHPPLYYCLIYTAESLFPQLGLPWVGLLPNFVCILAGAAVLYCTAKRLIGRFWPAWTPGSSTFYPCGYCRLRSSSVYLLTVFGKVTDKLTFSLGLLDLDAHAAGDFLSEHPQLGAFGEQNDVHEQGQIPLPGVGVIHELGKVQMGRDWDIPGVHGEAAVARRLFLVALQIPGER